MGSVRLVRYDETVGDYQEIDLGSSATDLALDNDDTLYVDDGGTVTGTTVAGGSYVILSGGTASNTTVTDDGLFDTDVSGDVSNTTLESGTMYVGAGVTITDTTVGAGGTLSIYGRSTGTLAVDASATVTVEAGGVLDFDISALAPGGSDVLVGNMGVIDIQGGCTITVSSTQAVGSYILADGAAAVASALAFTVISDDVALGNVTIGGSALAIGGSRYALLARQSDRLVLTIGSGEVPASDTEAPTLTGSLDYTARVGGQYEISLTNLVASDNVGVVGYRVYVDGDVYVSTDTTAVSSASVTLTTTGTHRVGVTAYDAAANESGEVYIYIDNPEDPFASAQYLGSDLTISGVEEASISVAGEQDYYCFTMTGTGNVTVKTSGVVPEEPEGDDDPVVVRDTKLYLYDNTRTQLAYDDDSGDGQFSKLTKSLGPGTYYIMVRAFEDTTIDEYSLSVDVTDFVPAGPRVLTVTADVTAPTNQNVTVSATFSDNTATGQYSFDESTWQTYTTGVTMTDNGTVYFRALDAADNASDVVSYTVSNIDRVPPEVLTITANNTSPTNQPVTVTATFSDDAVTKQYGMTYSVSSGDFLYNNYYGEWSEYVDGVVVDKNRAVYFRCIDAAGNVSENGKYLVTNIDTRVPVLVSVVADVTDPTNGDVTLTATFDDQSQIQYSLDGVTWTDVETSYTLNGSQPIGGLATPNGIYFGSVIVSANGTVYFRAVDPAGNISDIASYEVANIDKTAPEKPVASADITAPTNQSVTVTATFSDDTATKEYSLDGSTWLEYTTGVVMNANGTVYFRGIDAVGNISEVAGYEVDNISLVAPDPPVASADITTPTNQNVTVTATFDDITATKQYSFDNSTWQTYTTGVAMSDNGTVYFRGISAEGNVSNVTAYVVSNIDKVAPEQPVAAADRTQLTNLNVTVTATFSDDSARKQYRIDDGDWNDYTTGVVMTANGTVSFRGIDAAGNTSAITSYEVANIDTVPPEAPTVSADITTPTNGNVTLTVTFSADTVSRWMSFDNQYWMQCLTVITRSENGTVYFRGLDAAGNFSAVTSYTVSNIDRVPPEAPVASADVTTATNQDVTVTATFSDDTATKEYSLDGENWQTYTDGVVMSANGTVSFRGFDAAGNVSDVASYEVTNIDTVPPEVLSTAASVTTPTSESITVTATFSDDAAVKQYRINTGDWNEYTGAVEICENGTVYFRCIDAVGNISDIASYEVTNIVAPATGRIAGDLNGDGRADIVMSIVEVGHGAEGATGAWLIQENQTAAWGDLSQRNSGWVIFGTGITAAGKTTNDVYVKSADNVVGAWVTDATGKVAGWETVGQFDAYTQVLGLGDFNGDGQTDLLLRNTNGAVGCYFTSGDVTGWNYFQSLGDEWKISAVGDLNGDGRDDVVLKHDAGFAGSWLTQADYTMAWADLDTLPEGFAIVGAGDFNGDGTDDVLLKKDSYYGAWIVQNGNAAGWMGLGDLGNISVEQISDFDADGIDDLRLRTAAGDLGTHLVKGADTLQWKYYGSVGPEWSTSLAAL